VLSNAKYIVQANGSGIIEGALVDITDRKTAEERIQFLAYYDSLTELPNRTLLKDRLAKALASAKRHREKAAVLFLDLDRFKNINDSLGHSYGDLLLQELSTRLQTSAREQDTVARLGGDEFVLILTSIKEAADAAIAAERIINAVTKEFVLRGQLLNVTCSIGISMFPDHGEDVETLIKNADAAMYCSKDGGGNNFRFFSEEMNAQVSERLTLENSLHMAMEKQQLFLVYQPEIDVLTGSVTACEALLRWKHPELGMVPPDKFIKIAENSGLIVPIGEWVLRTACAEARRWQTDSALAIPVAVNVSAVQFRQDGFAQMVREVLQDTGLDPKLLELELTESLLLSNEDVVFQVLGQLQAMGLKLAIDDFGTGYSSLSYLKQFPVSKLKIDRSFIRDLGTNDDDDAAITAAIITMAKCLHLKVTAEGVENETQLSLLRRHSCDEVQGYLLSRPVSAELVTETLLKAYLADVPNLSGRDALTLR
jgi:diguanylate cyclase (GGDEF)-like protein